MVGNAELTFPSLQFFITTVPTPHLDGKHCVYGKVVSGRSTVRLMEDSPCQNDAPSETILIADCGELKDGEVDGQPVDPTADGYESYPSDDEHDTQDPKVVVKIATDLKTKGTEYFKQGDFKTAQKKYQKAIRCKPFLSAQSYPSAYFRPLDLRLTQVDLGLAPLQTSTFTPSSPSEMSSSRTPSPLSSSLSSSTPLSPPSRRRRPLPRPTLVSPSSKPRVPWTSMETRRRSR